METDTKEVLLLDGKATSLCALLSLAKKNNIACNRQEEYEHVFDIT